MDTYNNLSETQAKLLKRRVIDLVGKVDLDMVKYVREAVTRLNAEDSPDITVLLTSGGGFCTNGFDIYDILANYPGHVTGEILVYANSMASVILQACDFRLMAEHAQLLIHDPSFDDFNTKKLKNPRAMAAAANKSIKTKNKIIDIYLRRSAKSREQLDRQMEKNKAFTTREAIRWGLVDGVLQPQKRSITT